MKRLLIFAISSLIINVAAIGQRFIVDRYHDEQLINSEIADTVKFDGSKLLWCDRSTVDRKFRPTVTTYIAEQRFETHYVYSPKTDSFTQVVLCFEATTNVLQKVYYININYTAASKDEIVIYRDETARWGDR